MRHFEKSKTAFPGGFYNDLREEGKRVRISWRLEGGVRGRICRSHQRQRQKHLGFLINFPRCGAKGEKRARRLKAVCSQTSEMESDSMLHYFVIISLFSLSPREILAHKPLHICIRILTVRILLLLICLLTYSQ